MPCFNESTPTVLQGLSHRLRRALNYLYELLEHVPKRVFYLYPHRQLPLIVASDARMDDTAPPSLGILILDPVSGKRWGFVSILQAPLKSSFNDESTTIAHVELCAVVAAVMHMRSALADRDCLWLIDNSVALACLCKGNSDSAALDMGTAAVHFALAFLRSRIWFEYVESHANWADSVSRLLHACP